MSSINDRAAWRAWAGLGAGAGLLLLALVHRFAVGTLAGSLMAEFGASAVQLGVLASLYFYLYGAMQVPAGVMADTLGPRRTLLASGACLAAGAAVSGWAPDLGTAYVGRVLVGLGAAPIFVNVLRLIASWFDPWRFATLVGLLNGAASLGSFLAGAPLAAAADRIGWRGAFGMLAALTVLVTAAAWTLVRDRPRRGDLAPLPALLASLATTRAIAWNPEIWKALAVKAGFDSSHFLFFAVWGVPYLSQLYALPRAAASAFVSISVAGFALGAPCLGLLSDRVFRSRRVPLALAGAGYTSLWGVLLLLPPRGSWGPALMAVTAFLMGFLAASLLLTLSVARDAAPREAAGMAMALVNAGGFLSAAVFQVAASAIMDLLWTGEVAGGVRVYPLRAFHAAFLACLAVAAGSVIVALRLREPRAPGGATR